MFSNERFDEIVKDKLGAVNISADNPRLRELLKKGNEGTLSCAEHEELNKLSVKATKPFSQPVGCPAAEPVH